MMDFVLSLATRIDAPMACAPIENAVRILKGTWEKP